MLKDNAIYNSLFRFQNINLDNVNDIYFAINIIIIIIATTLFKTFIIVVFVFKFIIVIVFNVDNIVIVIIVSFKRFIFKFIVFDFDIKRRFIMSALFDKF